MAGTSRTWPLWQSVKDSLSSCLRLIPLGRGLVEKSKWALAFYWVRAIHLTVQLLKQRKLSNLLGNRWRYKSPHSLQAKWFSVASPCYLLLPALERIHYAPTLINSSRACAPRIISTPECHYSPEHPLASRHVGPFAISAARESAGPLL